MSRKKIESLDYITLDELEPYMAEIERQKRKNPGKPVVIITHGLRAARERECQVHGKKLKKDAH